MRLTSVLSEVWRNVLSGTARAPLFAILLAIIAGLGTAADIMIVYGFHTDARTYLNSGAAIRSISAENSINGSACESLTTYTNIHAAGALRQATELTIDSLPGVKLQTYEVTSGLTTLLGQSGKQRGIWISSSLAENLGVTAGSQLQSAGTTMKVAGIFDYPDDGRDSRFAYAVLLPVPADSELFSECWMQAWPQAEDQEGQLRSVVSLGAVDSTDTTIAQLNKNLGASFDGHSMFTKRISQWVPLMTLLAGFLVGLTWTQRRKLEHAASLHSGQSRIALSTSIMLEALIWATLGTAIAGMTTWFVTAVFAMQDLNWASDLMRPPLLSALAGAILGALTGSLLVRETGLFRYFKDR